MGNEASIAQQPENDGLQPPSQTQPAEAFDHSNIRTSSQTINAMFRRGGQKPDDGHDTARTSAENGHMPFGSPSAASLSLSAQQLQAHQYINSHMRSPELLYVNSQIPVQHQPYDPRQQSHLQQQHQNYHHTPLERDSSADPMDLAQPTHPTVGVMYANDSSNVSSRTTGNSFRNGGKVVREGGRKVINSLKNLSLGQRGSKKKTQKDENEWETKWDEDDDESDEEIDDVKMGPVSAVTHLRPGMDGGHSSLSPTMATVEPVRLTALISQEATLHVAIATRQHAALESALDANGLGWETGTDLDMISPQDSLYERPNIQMFLPLLRVLGKGSFGKVRILLHCRVD